MSYSNTLTFGALLGCLAFASSASAAMYSVDVDAPVVKLRKSCIESNATLKNCFDTLDSMNSWVTGTRKPNAAKPLLVEIGPGTFIPGAQRGGLECRDSNITYRGAGQDNTKIAAYSRQTFGMSASGNCTNLNVENLTLEGLFGVYWPGTGSSTWTNVTVRGFHYSWIDSACPGQSGGKHYWYSSRVIVDSRSFEDGADGLGKGYGIHCGESWFFGSELLAMGGNGGARALYVNTGEAHVYGGVIRTILHPATAVTPPRPTGASPDDIGDGLFAVLAANNGSVHIHGTGIDVIGNSSATDIAALMAATGGEIHANGAAYNLSTGAGGKIHRIINTGGHVHAPYLWESHTTPPVNAKSTTNNPGNTLVSITGADMAVETDCASTGCQSTGTETHLLIYNNACTGPGGTWFDTVTRACR